MATKVTKTENKEVKVKRESKGLSYSIVSVILGLLFGAVIIMATGHNVGAVFSSLWNSTFGSISSIGDFLGTFGWVLMIGLSMMVSFRVGIFNIGSAGQMFAGGFVGYIVALAIGDSLSYFGTVVVLLASVATAALIAWFIAFLKNQFNVNEVISSIMINWILFYLVQWMFLNIGDWTNGFISTSQSVASVISLRVDGLTKAFGGSTYVNYGFIVAIIIFVIVLFAYKKTTFGYKQDLIGNNITVGDYISLNKKKEFNKAMILSGALAGVAAWMFYFGANVQFLKPVGQLKGQLFEGTIISLIGFNEIWGLFASALLVSIFVDPTTTGEVNALVNGMPITDLILASILIFISISGYFMKYRPQDNWFNSVDDEEEEEKEKTKKKKGGDK